MKKAPGEAAITSAALKGAHVSPQVLVATVILRRDGRRKQQTRLLKLQEDKEDFYKKVIEIVVQKDSMDFIFKSR